MTPPRVLLAEDDERSRDILTRRLTRKGFEVHATDDGRAMLEQALRQPPDLFLIDLTMEDVDGWDAIRWLRQQPELRDIPAIALTAHSLDGIARAAINAGFDAFEGKPIDLPRLIEQMRALLSEHA